jgi:tetratricopeptide (TPR) repeat protein
MLETIRHHAHQRLAEHPDELLRARLAHAVHYRSLAEDVDKSLRGPDLERLLDRLTAEHDNVLTALAWYAQHGPGEEELQLAADLARYCHLRGRYREGRRWLDGALSRASGAATAELARAQLSAAYLALFDCDYASAAAHGEHALAAHRVLANLPATARALSLLASVHRESGRYQQSLARYAEAVATYRETDNQAGLADTLQMAGFTSWLAGDLTGAERLVEDGLARFNLLRDPEGVASGKVHLAAVAHYRGEPERARWLAEDALARFRGLAFKEGIAWALNVLGLVEQHDGAPDRAIERLRASLEIHCAVGDRWRCASVLETLAAVLADGGQTLTAAELLGTASAIRDAIGAPVAPVERPSLDATVAKLGRALTDRQHYTATSRGEALRLSDLPGRLVNVAVPAGSACPSSTSPGPLAIVVA